MFDEQIRKYQRIVRNLQRDNSNLRVKSLKLQQEVDKHKEKNNELMKRIVSLQEKNKLLEENVSSTTSEETQASKTPVKRRRKRKPENTL